MKYSGARQDLFDNIDDLEHGAIVEHLNPFAEAMINGRIKQFRHGRRDLRKTRHHDPGALFL